MRAAPARTLALAAAIGFTALLMLGLGECAGRLGLRLDVGPIPQRGAP